MLHEHGPCTRPALYRRHLVLPMRTIRATIEQLQQAGFVECTTRGVEITRHGRAYLASILGVPILRPRDVFVRRDSAAAHMRTYA